MARLGKRERAALREATATRKAIISANLNSPKPNVVSIRSSFNGFDQMGLSSCSLAPHRWVSEDTQGVLGRVQRGKVMAKRAGVKTRFAKA